MIDRYRQTSDIIARSRHTVALAGAGISAVSGIQTFRRRGGMWDPPLCSCGGILKPDTVLFGEPLPRQALMEASREAETCGVMPVIGTSAVVLSELVKAIGLCTQ